MTNGRAQANTLTILHNLYFSENKPETLQPLDLALATYLLLRQTEDHFIWDSQDTLATRLGCDRGTIKRAIDRLVAAGWVLTKAQTRFSEKTKRTTRAMGKTVGLAINLDGLPDYDDRATRPAVSEDAKELARRHTAFLDHGRKPRRRHKGFGAMQGRAAQRLLDDWGDLETVRKIFNWAKDDPRFEKAAHRSLYEFRRRSKAIWRAWQVQLSQSAAESPAPQQPSHELPQRIVKAAASHSAPIAADSAAPQVVVTPAQPMVKPNFIPPPTRRPRLPQ